MKKIDLLYIISFFSLLTSCSETEIERYSGKNYIYFEKSSKDSTVFSFAYDPNLSEGDISLKMKIISRLENTDRTYAVKFLADESTAKEGKDFIWQNNTTIVKANDSISYLNIKAIKTPELKGKTVKAVFEIVPTDDFIPGIEDNRKANVIISNKLTKPIWWNGWHDTSGLGLYSDKKYQLFIEVTGQHDLTLTEDGGSMDFSDMYGYVVMFKYWLLDNPQKEEDGSDMFVPIIG